ncbi:MAG TPA: alpha/beta fold hydrolase [Acidimicrobiales bacterium]
MPTHPDGRPRLATLTTGDGPRIVLVHGFTQTAQCWGRFADLLAAAHHALVAVDAPGHGRSEDVRATFEEGAQLLGEAGGRAIYIGYSMGGRYALRLALDRPELVRALVLIGASPGIDDDTEREARRAADERRAEQLERDGVEAFVDDWLRQPLFATLPPDAAHRDERLRNTAAGLASSLRLAGTGAMEPLWSRLATIRMPVLLVTGEHDTKFVDIARRMVEAMDPHAWSAVVSGAGHSVHLEQPGVTAELVTSWLRTKLQP